ncbi:pulmonary surfactant-associated protein D-like isoform X1 [Zootoca vivipara]|uniref:pulmonary surfactant-associated protein D-like isoform X1 n=1 Tax=Zootoca vivipara TaxID=8524 RepID=UPI0015926529|nr:pulmonary surfactant-associated protein D-like isoform X1 [Zootoca vivipara]
MDQTMNPNRPYIQRMLILLILSSLVRGASLQRTTSSAPRLVLSGWVPNACTLVVCGSSETRPKGEEGDQGLPRPQGLQGPAGPTGIPGSERDFWWKGISGGKGSRGNSNLPELESLKTQIRDLETELEGLKAAITKTQRVLLPPNGVMVGERIFKTDGSRGDYDAARETCSRLGGALAFPRNAAENSALQKIVTWHNRRAVLGINDMATEGRFENLNGDAIAYSNWARGEPNNLGNEDCVEMHEDGKWHDRGCTLEWLVICEF